MKRTLITLTAAVVMAGCAATHDRPMNKGEKTIVSDKVLAMVEENGGKLDIRKTDNVKCVRNRLVGSHMVQRVCYTLEEFEALAANNKKAYYARFGANKCLDQARGCRNRDPRVGGPQGEF